MNSSIVIAVVRITLGTSILFISFLSFQDIEVQSIANLSDKFLHFSCFLYLTIMSWLSRIFYKELWLYVIVLAYGILIEIVQIYIPYRSFEFLDILQLAKNHLLVNPTCKKCNKKMKSKGSKQGFECVNCGNRSISKSTLEIPRKIQCKLYLPSVSAHRHLTRPYQRIKKRNKNIQFKTSIPWMHVF